jgi:hypothetical protein
MVAQKNNTDKPLHIHDAHGDVHVIPPGCPIPEWATPPIKTQSLVIQTHFPILKPVPAQRILDPNEFSRPRPITVTGNNVPSCSRPYLNRTIDRETARVIASGRARPNEPEPEDAEQDTEAAYQAELVEVRGTDAWAHEAIAECEKADGD